MKTSATKQKVECLNPNTGARMNIDAEIYQMFSKAIYHTLKTQPAITYTQLVDGIKKCFKEQKNNFRGSVEWYAVTVKNDMEVSSVIETWMEKGKKLHRLKTAQKKKNAK